MITSLNRWSAKSIYGGVLLALVAIGVIILLLWHLSRGSLEVRRLVAGDHVLLQSGLSFVVPEDMSGTWSSWHSDSRDSSSGGLAESIVFDSARHHSVPPAIDVYSHCGKQSTSLRMVLRQRLVSRSKDRTTEIRWMPPHTDVYNVFVIVRLDRHLPCVVMISAPNATSPAGAWKVVAELWRRLDVLGVSVPPRPE